MHGRHQQHQPGTELRKRGWQELDNLPMLRGRSINRAALLLALALCLAAFGVRAAEKQIGNSCLTDVNSADWDTIARCVSGTFVRSPYFFGTTSDTCDGTIAGLTRYNSGALQLCDGTSWQTISISSCDNAPATVVFGDQTNLTVSTLTTSNIALVTGMDSGCNAIVGVSGTGGSPEYRVCSDAACSSVTQNWTNANNTLAMQGKYVQLRATSSGSVATAFTITLAVGSVNSTWTISTGMSGCAPEGTVCSDGTVYAGLSGASTPMYVTRCDPGQTWNGSACTGTRTVFCWNNCNTTGYVTTSQTGTSDGQTYTANLITIDSDSVVSGTQQHIAAQYCADLSQNGHSDWYLPAKNELNTMYTNNTAIGGFDTSGTYYWSSSETSISHAWIQRFSDGFQYDGSGNVKNIAVNIRCARR